MDIICRFFDAVLDSTVIALLISACGVIVATLSLRSSRKVAAEQIAVLKKEKRPYLSVVNVHAEDDKVSSLSVSGFHPVVCLRNTGKCIIHYEVEELALFRRLRTKEKYPALHMHHMKIWHIRVRVNWA